MPYPFDKLDLIAIPLTVSFAMENAGLITYGAPSILREARRRRRRASGASRPASARTSSRTSGSATSSPRRGGTTSGSTRRSRPGSRTRSSTAWRPDYDRGAARIDARARARSTPTRSRRARRIRQPIELARRHLQRVRRHHLPEGRDGPRHVRALDRRGAVPPRRARLPRRARATAPRPSTDFLAALAQASRQPVTPAFDTFLNQNGVPQIDVRLQCDGRRSAARPDAASA